MVQHQTYENAFFRPKPAITRNSASCNDIDIAGSVNAFSCTESWWHTNIETYINKAKETYGKTVSISSDNLESKRIVDIYLDDQYIVSARNKEGVAVALKSIDSMLTLLCEPLENPDETEESQE